MALIDYLSFLKLNFSDAYALENTRLLKSKNIPLFRFFSHLTDAEIIESTKRGFLKFVDNFEHGTQYIAIEESMKRWVNNENAGFSKEQVKIEDLTNIYAAQKESILHFINHFTTDASTCIEIFKEIEEYFSTVYQITIETFIYIHNEELKASEKKYRLLAENSSDIISRQNPDGVVTYISPSCKYVLGYDPEELIGKKRSDFEYNSDTLGGSDSGEKQSTEAGETSVIRMKRKDGTPIWLELSVKNIIDADTNEVTEIHTSARNVTQRKLAEEKLKQNEFLLSESQRIAKIGSWEWDITTNEMTWSVEHYALYGLDPEAGRITYEMAAAVRHPDDTDFINRTLGESLKYRRPISFVHRLLVDDQVKVVQVKGELITENDEVVKLRGTSQDITQISTIQQQIVKKNRQLEEAQHVAHLGSWEWDTVTDTVIWTDEMYRIFGYEPQTIPISFTFYIQHIFQGDRELEKEHIALCLKDGTGYSSEIRVIRSDGQMRWLMATGQATERKDEKVVALSGTVYDITERKKIELALDDRLKDLERSNNDLQLYASIASHDLKEPLRKIKANSSILVDNFAHILDEKGRKYVQRIVGSATRMEKLIEDVLSVSKLSGKKGDFENADLNKIVKQCIGDLDVQLKSSGATIKVDKLPVNVLVNAGQMYQLFQNLLLNSVKFRREGVPLTITISCTIEKRPGTHKEFIKPPKFYKIVFSDNGIGFDPVFSEKIFVMFQRLNEREKYEGTGIGLAICKKIAENHEGFIEAIGEPDKGAIFTISLPVRTV